MPSTLGKYHICKTCKHREALRQSVSKWSTALVIWWYVLSLWTHNVWRLGYQNCKWQGRYRLFQNLLGGFSGVSHGGSQAERALWLLWCYELQHCMPCYKWVTVDTEKSLCTLYTEMYFPFWQFLFRLFPSSFLHFSLCSPMLCVAVVLVGWLCFEATWETQARKWKINWISNSLFHQRATALLTKCSDATQDTGEEHWQSLYNSSPTGAGRVPHQSSGDMWSVCLY